jgi:hypothetical protein
MTNQYTVDRSNDCDIIPNATDKPIKLLMHHFHCRSLIINLKTGDILTHLFSDGSTSSAQKMFQNSPVSQMQHDIFLEQEGAKSLFILKTNYSSPLVASYINELKDRSVKFESEIVADIKNEFSEFEKYQYGEISTEFVIDLKNPKIIKTIFGGEKGSDIVQDSINIIGSDKSTLPNIEEQIQIHYSHTNIGKLIAWADDRLPDKLKKSNIKLNDLSAISGHISNSVILSMKSERPFSNDYLYDEKYSKNIINTLEFVKSNGLDTLSILYLCDLAISQLNDRIYNIYDEDESDNGKLITLLLISKYIINFSLDFINSIDSTKYINHDLYAGIKYNILRFNKRESQVF